MLSGLLSACVTVVVCFQGHDEDLKQWDVTFWAERMREAKYDISDEALRPYFSLPNVLDGLFKVSLLATPHCRLSSHFTQTYGRQVTVVLLITGLF